MLLDEKIVATGENEVNLLSDPTKHAEMVAISRAAAILGDIDLGEGIRFNLYNNKWGTNFPQWWEGDLRARFILEFLS